MCIIACLRVIVVLILIAFAIGMGDRCRTAADARYHTIADCGNAAVRGRPCIVVILAAGSAPVHPALAAVGRSCECDGFSHIHRSVPSHRVCCHIHGRIATECKECRVIRHRRFCLFLGGFFCGLLAAGLLGCRLRLYLRLFRLILRRLLLGARLRLSRSLRFLYRLLLYLGLYLRLRLGHWLCCFQSRLLLRLCLNFRGRFVRYFCGLHFDRRIFLRHIQRRFLQCRSFLLSRLHLRCSLFLRDGIRFLHIRHRKGAGGKNRDHHAD